MEIKRNNYLSRLISKKGNGLIKVITGIRRCGKSYLLFHLYYNYLISNGVSENNIICISLDDTDYEEYREPHALNEYIKSKIINKNEQYFVFIDEAQYAITKEELKNPDVPIGLYGVLNSLIRKDNVDIYITGSNSKFLSSDVMTEFRGRGDEIHIAPLAFSEFYPAIGKDKQEAWNDYLLYGGLPHILAEADSESKSRYLDRLNKEIFLRDICERYDIRDENGMDSLMKVIASSIGSLSNAQKISDTFRSSGNKGISMPTIANYLTYLQESFVIQKAERYDIKGRKYISTPSKYYYTDLGLRNALLNFRQIEETHLMENAIYNELIYRGYSVDVGIVEVRVDEDGKKIRKKLEIDFVINRGNKRYYIQSAFAMPDEAKKEQEQRPLLLTGDGFKKIIITKDALAPLYNENGVLVMSIFDFLLDPDSLDK